MAVSAQKAKAPIESVIVSPINESVTFSPNNTIIYRIGSDDLSYLLPQDSYFNMDVKFTFNDAAKPKQDLIIRAAPMFFDNVRVIHAGNEVYYSQYNIAQQFLDYVKTGSDLLDRDFCQYATHDTYKENNKTATMSSPLIIKESEWEAQGTPTTTHYTCIKRGITMRLGQVIKIFSQCDMMPLKYLAQQVEFRFMLAKPEDFMCTMANNTNLCPLKGNSSTITGENEFTKLSSLSYTVEKSRFYMFGAAIDPGYDAVLSTENQTGAAKMWRYLQPRINLRNMPESSPGYYISNFQCITENTDKIFIWATRDTNYACTIRPKITNCNIRFGPYQIPKAPTAEDNWTKPALYKALVDDTLEYSTAYYTITNKELANSYTVLPAQYSGGTIPAAATSIFALSPHDTHIMIAGSFTTDDDKLGSNSKAWNSQYNLHYNLEVAEKPFIWVFAVDTEYVLTLKNGMLTSTNL